MSKAGFSDMLRTRIRDSSMSISIKIIDGVNLTFLLL